MIKKTKQILSGDHMIQLIDVQTNQLIAEDTLDSFVENNLDDYDVLMALYDLKSCKLKEKVVPTFLGYNLLRASN
jgi:hypothetical protein